jgi:ribosomal protein L28
MFGHSIAHSGKRSKRTWKPNVIKKRVWSDALDDWVQFKMTTRALKEIDNIGGIDNYMLKLDEKSVSDSKKNTKVRNLIAHTLFFKGELEPHYVKKLGYLKDPPVDPSAPVVVA